MHKRLVADDDVLDDEVTIQCAHGDSVSYPLAVVKINIAGKDIVTTATVSSTFPASALLGWDVPELVTLVSAGSDPTGPPEEDVLAVLTRLRKRQHPGSGPETGVEARASPSPIDATPNTKLETEAELFEFNFDDSFFSTPGSPQAVLTRSQKRENRDTGNDADPRDALDVSAQKLQALQESDGSLQQARMIADGMTSAMAGEKFFRCDGVLYRRFTPPGTDDDVHDIEQLVLPTQCRPAVLQLAHNIPMAGPEEDN